MPRRGAVAQRARMVVKKQKSRTQTVPLVTASPQRHLARHCKRLIGHTHTRPLVPVYQSETSCPLIKPRVCRIQQHRVRIHLREMNVLGRQRAPRHHPYQ